MPVAMPAKSVRPKAIQKESDSMTMYLSKEELHDETGLVNEAFALMGRVE
jgi:hypothetical protein